LLDTILFTSECSSLPSAQFYFSFRDENAENQTLTEEIATFVKHKCSNQYHSNGDLKQLF
jgi:hypothetical protein